MNTGFAIVMGLICLGLAASSFHDEWVYRRRKAEKRDE
jgi:hypothetical protein